MPAPIHRTAVFAVHHPTRHVRAVLERVFRDYSAAYTALLHAAAMRYDASALRGFATYDATKDPPRMSARTLAAKLFAQEEMAQALSGACAPLESRLRQSVREHVGQTLLSYVALADAQAKDPTRGGAPQFPARLRPEEVEETQAAALIGLANLADNVRGERNLFAALLSTRVDPLVAIPFVGVDPRYGCGLYYNPDNKRFYARLDVVGSSWNKRLRRPIEVGGTYIEVKNGTRYRAHNFIPSGTPPGHKPAGETFGTGKKSILVPLAFGQRLERRYRFTDAAFLPQRGIFDPATQKGAVPVSGKLVRRGGAHGDANARYELHVSFEFERPESDGVADEERPLLALNRGIYHLVAGVLTSPDATRVVGTFAVSGAELRARQEALERVRRDRQQRGVHVKARDRRQSRLAEHHVASVANQIVAEAIRFRAQVVMEDMTSFATGAALREKAGEQPRIGRRFHSAAQVAALRAILNRRQFEAVVNAVDERLALTGLPPVRRVNASWVSRTCIQCGVVTERGTPSTADMAVNPRVFRCAQCGTYGDVDAIAAVNIARKLAWLRLRGVEKRANIPDEQRTPWHTYAAQHVVSLAVSLAPPDEHSSESEVAITAQASG